MKPGKHTALALRPLKLPPRSTVQLTNGLFVTALKRGPLPMVSLRFVTRAGSSFDPSGRYGLADLTARLLRRGAGGMSGDELAEAVDFVGASLNTWAGEDSFGVSLTTPVEAFGEMLSLFARVVREPDFPVSEVAVARRRTLAQLTNALDDPDDVADRALVGALFAGHPYGHETVGIKVDVEAIGREDLMRFHAERLSPDGAHLFVVGDIEAKAAVEAVERAFGSWPRRPVERSLPAWKGPARAGDVLIVDKPEQTQVQVRIASQGVPRGNPDHFTVMVMNSVLGGSFTSRLMQQIRVKRGLTYGAGSHFDELAQAGSFTVSSFTKTETVPELIEVALGEVAKMKAKGPTQAELLSAQRFISGLYPSRLETNESIAAVLGEMALYGQPADYIERYRERVTSVTTASAAEAAARLLPGDQKVIVLVGNASQLEKAVSGFGRTHVVPVAQLE
jgi:zinc protease